VKKAVCISCTHHYNERTVYVEEALAEAGYEITYITSDFSHTAKVPFQVDLPHCTQVPTIHYKKNLSVARILSHIRFAKDAMRQVRKHSPDLLYVEVPPNSLCAAAARYKKKNLRMKLIFDIFDMWPESFPNSRAKQLLRLPFGIWGSLRNRNLAKADVVLTECDLFQEKLRRYLKDTTAKTLHLCRRSATTREPVHIPSEEALHLCYLGNINNIIDIPTICRLLSEIRQLRPVVLHVIGDGESRETFLTEAAAAGAQVVYHGKIYDPDARQAIFDQCSFGLNIMKSSVCVGLTMKSVDYFAGGLPILNTIEADTKELVERAQIGINVCREDLARTARAAAQMTPERRYQMAANTLQVFEQLFAEDVFRKKLLSCL